jgi:hypothetical protein
VTGATVRPSITGPLDLQPRAVRAAQRQRWAGQPRLGALGLLLVLPVAVLLAVSAGGPEPSLLVLAPLVTFGLPVVAMIAFWWDDWPGTTLRASWSGWADTVLVVVGAAGLTLLGQAVVGGVDVRGVVDSTAGPGHRATFPATMPVAGAAFVAMLQLTLVCEGWPLRGRLGRTAGGLAALALAWLIALLTWVLVLDGRVFSGAPRSGGLLAGAQLGALLVLVGAAQVAVFVLWRGWPVARSGRRAVRLLSGNALVLAVAALSYGLTSAAGADPGAVSAAAGSFVAAGLLYGMLFEGFLRDRLPAGTERAALVGLTVASAVVLDVALQAYAGTVLWTRGSADEWVTHATLNAIGVGIILHVAIGRRWPFVRTRPEAPSADPH